MGKFVGDDRRALLGSLVEQYDAVAAGKGPALVSLESPLGLGKTRAIQELYQHLAAHRQETPGYWPRAIVADEPTDVLRSRKLVQPPPGWVLPGGVEIPWLWWGISCQLSHAGSPMRALKDASDHLRPHLEPLLVKLQRSAHGREDAFNVLAGVFDLVGVLNPGAAFEAGSKFMRVWRRRRQQQAKLAAMEMDRRVEAHIESYEEAARLAEGLTAVASVGTPIVLVVDDAQWADPALVSLLRHLIGLQEAAVMILTSARPELLAEQASHGVETFGALLADVEANQPRRLTRRRLNKLDDSSLGELVLEVAPLTPPATVRGIAEIASGNPLVLNLVLDLDLIRRDISADGKIDTDPADLQRLPSDLRVIYQELWGQLPEPVRRVLAIAAVQGPEFLPSAIPAAATRLGIHQEMSAAFDAAEKTFGWVRRVNEYRYEFSEHQRFDLAHDVLREVFDDQQQDVIRRAVVDAVLEVKSSQNWRAIDNRTRRVALESHLELDAKLPPEAERNRAQVADSMVQLGMLELDAGITERAVDLAAGAHRIYQDLNADDSTILRVRGLWGQALASAGRTSEAVTALAGVLAHEEAPTAAVGSLLEELKTEIIGSEVLVTEPVHFDERPPLTAAAEAREVGHQAPQKSDGAFGKEPPAAAEVDEWGRQPWRGWEPREIPWLPDLDASEVADLICEVVAAQGPVVSVEVYDALKLASGAAREGTAIRAALDNGVREAVRRGDLVALFADMYGDSDMRYLRLTAQPDVVMRYGGDRSIWGIPPKEFTELGRRIAEREPHLDRDALKRRIATLYGYRRYASSIDEWLELWLPPELGEADAHRPDRYGRAPWHGWDHRMVPKLTDLEPAEIAGMISEVVAAEGPVLSDVVYDLLRAASGAARMGSAIRASLERGLAHALENGSIRSHTEGPEQRVVLTNTTQPEVRLRQVGDRGTWGIPPEELTELARRVIAAEPQLDRLALKRRMSKLLGWSQYTTPFDQLIESLLPDEAPEA